MLIVQGIPPLGSVKQWCSGETSSFVAKCYKEVAYALSIDTNIDDLG